MRTTVVMAALAGLMLATPALATPFTASPGELPSIRSAYFACMDDKVRQFVKRESEFGMDVTGETSRACAPYVEIAQSRDPSFASKMAEDGFSRISAFMFKRARGR